MENTNKEGFESLNLEKIKEVLPHRDKWLLLKEVLFVDKNFIKAKTWFERNLCEGHFKDRAVVPGALLGEAMKQAGAFMVIMSQTEKDKDAPLIRQEAFEYERVVLPGETVEIEVRLLSEKLGFYFLEGEIKKGDQRVMKGKFTGVKASKNKGLE